MSACDDVRLFLGVGEDDHGNETCPILGAQTLQDLQASDSRQAQAEQDDAGQGTVPVHAEEIVQGLDAVPRDHERRGGERRLDRATREDLIVAVVLDQEDRPVIHHRAHGVQSVK